MFNCLNNEQENPNRNLLIQKIVQGTVHESFKELKITNQKNDRGQQSRADNLNNILNDIQPDIFILIKAKVSKKFELKFQKYTAFVKSIGINNTEGIIILVSDTFVSAIAETTETKNPNLYTLKLQTSTRSYIIGAYGPQ